MRVTRAEVVAICVLLISVALFAHRVLYNYWTEYGALDSQCTYGAGLSIINGTHEYIHEFGSLMFDDEAWCNSPLFQNDPDVFRCLVRFPGIIVPFNHPPVLAVLASPFVYVMELHTWFAFWWVLSVGSYVGVVWAVVRNRSLRWWMIAVALQFGPFLHHLQYGQTILITMGLAILGGSCGISIAGWFKVYPWILAFKRKRFLPVVMWSVGLFSLWLVFGNIQEWSDLRVLWQWATHVSGVSALAQQDTWVTYFRMIVAAIMLVVGLRRKWHDVTLFAVAQGLSPMWWGGYWVVWVPVAAHLVSLAYEYMDMRFGPAPELRGVV